MKKFFCVITALIYLCLFTMPCSAAGTGREVRSESMDILIDVEYTLAEGEYRSTQQEGKYTVVLDDGTVITARPQTDTSGLMLAVYPIPKTDADTYSWFAQCTRELGNKRSYYDIYFVGTDGNRVDGGKCEITISLSDSFGTPEAAMLDRDGTVTMLETEVEKQSVSFMIPGSGYYVLSEELLEKPADSPKPDNPKKPADSTNSTNSSSHGKLDNSGSNTLPRTGDENHAGLWVFGMLASAALMITVIYQKKIKT